MLEIQKKTLEDLFDYFNEKKFNNEFTNKPVITIQTRGRKGVLGWCTINPIWNDDDENFYYEINISAENLGDGLMEVSHILLHEMCHLYNLQNDIRDCNPKTQYHNKKFKDVAESVGLLVEKDKRYGYGFTSLSDEVKEEISNISNYGIDDVFNIRRGIKEDQDEKEKDEDGKDKPKVKRIFKYVCPKCNTEIKSKYSGLEIICKSCETSFEEQE